MVFGLKQYRPIPILARLVTFCFLMPADVLLTSQPPKRTKTSLATTFSSAPISIRLRGLSTINRFHKPHFTSAVPSGIYSPTYAKCFPASSCFHLIRGDYVLRKGNVKARRTERTAPIWNTFYSQLGGEKRDQGTLRRISDF